MIIGLTGYMGVGKKAIANIVAKEMGFIKISFADKVKSTLSALYNIPVSIFDDAALMDMPMLVFDGKSPHQVVVETDAFFRKISGTRLIDQTKNTIKMLSKHGSNVVIVDIRSHDEVKVLRDMGGVLIYVESQLISKGHESEKDIHSISLLADYKICNNNDVSVLGQMKEIIKSLRIDCSIIKPISILPSRQAPLQFVRWGDGQKSTLIGVVTDATDNDCIKVCCLPKNTWQWVNKSDVTVITDNNELSHICAFYKESIETLHTKHRDWFFD